MKNRVAIFSGVLFTAAVAVALLVLLNRPGRRVSGPLRHEVYVWQRAWTQPVRDAVAQRATNFAELVLLKAEISWNDKQPELVRVTGDYAALGRTGRPVGFALRIGPYPGPFAADDAIGRFISDTAASLVAEARSNGVSPVELQLDFDCATSKLDGYRVWVEAIQRRVAPLPVTITALPSWLRSPAFKRLADAAPNYVLQVHSVERPASLHAPFTLCDPAEARRAVERAGRLGIPFRVALPTYGYLLAYDAKDEFLGLSAEGPRRNWPAGAKLREVSSNPLESAALLQRWTADRPAAMRGVIWYRLPVATDSYNWRWPTLGAMLAARLPRESIHVNTRRVEAGKVEVRLVNDGELDLASPLAVEARWSGARLVAGEGQNAFQLLSNGPSAASFQTPTQPCRLPAGESRVVGWLRFNRDCDVKCEGRKF